MSKVSTLIKFIAYQKQHPHANNSQIAEAVGITPRYLRECKGDVNLLKHYLSDHSLDADQIRFLMSMLDRHNLYQRTIYQQLQKQLNLSYKGFIRRAGPDEKPLLGWLDIGGIIPAETVSKDQSDSPLHFWLRYLCYEPLMWSYRNGEVEERLATSIQPVKGFSHWLITLRTDLFWSDGKPITQKDVIQALYSSLLASIIAETKSHSKSQLHILLAQEDPLFPMHFGRIIIRPSHSKEPYRVISGAYRLKNFSLKSEIFRLERNRDYYRQNEIGIDLITFKCFKRDFNAIKAVLSQKLDFLPLRALQPLHQVSKEASPQQWPFVGESYYILFLNRRKGLLADKNNCHLLSELVDYRAINRYLHAGQIPDEEELKSPYHRSLDLRIYCFKDAKDISYLAYLVGKSAGSSVVNPIFFKDEWAEMRENADAFLTQIFFGDGYRRLSQFFHSDGRLNPFFYSNPQIDELLSLLDQTADMVKREVIGQQALKLLQDDFAMILLSPCFEYVLSPLEIQFDDKLSTYADFIQNMSRLVVHRRF